MAAGSEFVEGRSSSRRTDGRGWVGVTVRIKGRKCGRTAAIGKRILDGGKTLA